MCQLFKLTDRKDVSRIFQQKLLLALIRLLFFVLFLHHRILIYIRNILEDDCHQSLIRKVSK